ncbi:MAG: hypothetical protein QGH51_10015 [Planctomycetota bacterium]|nr:hypothetical protein [Planctomycetota bacterium]
MKTPPPAAIVLLLLSACMKAPDPALAAGHPQPPSSPSGPSTPAMPQSPHAPSVALDFSVPADWEAQKATNGFTLKKWTLSGGGVCTVTAVGGDIGANFDRWANQFDLGEQKWSRESMEGSVYPTEVMKATGTLMAVAQIGGGEPRPNWSLIGAAISETPMGSMYVKVLGPAEVLATQEESILLAIKSLSFGS